MAKSLEPKPLNVIERGELRKAEATIETGQRTFMDVGNALLAIRDGRLYRESYKTFDAYCNERWGLERNYANKLIAGTKVVESLGTTVPKPETEGQARELGKVPEESREAVMEAASEATGGHPTAKAIKEAADTLLAPEEPEEEPAREPTVPELMAAANSELSAISRDLTAISKRAEELANPHLTDDKHGRLEAFKAAIRTAKGILSAAKGAGKCTYCDGGQSEPVKGCGPCLKTGWLTKTALESAPEKAA